MRKHDRNALIISALSGVLFLPVGNALADSPRVADSARVIEVIADRDNTFKVPGQKKPVIVVKRGEAVTLKITSHAGPERARDGSVHSFVIRKLRDHGWDLRLKEGTQEFSLTAPKDPGEYFVECTVKCGRGHDDMNMKMIVQ